MSSAARAAVVVAAAYVAWVAHTLSRRSPIDLALVGRRFLTKGQGHSAVIDGLAAHAHSAQGYDGQSALFLALDPLHAHHYLDEPVYRSSRVLYPLVAYLIGGGQAHAIPTALVLLNVLAVVAGTFLLAILLRRRGVSSWFALVYGLSPALFVSVDRDLTEPLAYCLVIAALLAFDANRLGLMSVLFGLAGTARETALVFGVALVVALAAGLGVSRLRPTRLATLATVIFAPFVLIRLGLYTWLGADPPPGPPREWVPFRGLLSHGAFDPGLLRQLIAVVVPALLAVFFVSAIVRRAAPEVVALMLNVLVLVLLLPSPSFDGFESSGRITLGVPVAFLFAVPLIPARLRLGVAVLLTMLWFLPWNYLLPHAVHA